MVHLDLFSGIGGFALACQWNGIETIGFVEIDKYCQKVLRKHWPNAPIVEDIRDVERIKEVVANAQRERCSWGKYKDRTRPEERVSARSSPSTPDTPGGRLQQCQYQGESPTDISQVGEMGRWRGNNGAESAILITAGFPCQPFSVAGKQLSQADDRYLWPQTIAVIKEVEPQWVLLENVTGIINLALDTVLSDLESAGYAYEPLVIPACAVNARHRRDRIWVTANRYRNVAEPSSHGQRRSQLREFRENNGEAPTGQADAPEVGRYRTLGAVQDVANSSINGLEGQKPVCEIRQSSSGFRYSGENWWATEPELGRVANGIPRRVDRLKCLGNAIVPQVAYEIIKVIKDVADSTI